MSMRKDLYFLVAVSAFFLPFFIFPEVFQVYYDLNLEHGLLMSFVKFFMKIYYTTNSSTKPVSGRGGVEEGTFCSKCSLSF